MSVSLPAIEQQSPKLPGKQGRGGSSVGSDGQGFGKLLKSNAGGHKGPGLSVHRADAGQDATTTKLPVDLDAAADSLLSLADMVEVKPAPDEIEEPPLGDDQGDHDSADGAEALFPLLSIAEFRDPKAMQSRGRNGSSGGAEGVAAKDQPTLDGETVVERKQGPLATVAAADGDPTARPAETAFGKSLIANLNDLATQAPARAAPAEGTAENVADGPDPAGARLARGKAETRGERNAILAEAVTQAAAQRETGDKRAEARTASANPTAVAAPPLQLPLSTGTPIVEALAANSTAAVRAVEIASQSNTGTAQSLKVQLHPAELGMVTAKLRMTDGQLSIEIEVETPDAYNRLSGENDAIAKALRSHGISVDQVVIQAPQTQSGSSARDSAGNFGDTSSGAGGNSSGSTEFGQSNGSGHANRNAGHDNGHEIETGSAAQQRSDSGNTAHGVYI